MRTKSISPSKSKMKAILFAALLSLTATAQADAPPVPAPPAPAPAPVAPAPQIGNPAVLKVKSAQDDFKVQGQRFTNKDIPGIEDIHSMDDIIYNDAEQTVIVGTKDQHIYRVDLKRKSIEMLTKTPLSPSGMKVSPANPDLLYFCSLRFFGDGQAYNKIPYDDSDMPGVYELNMKTKQLRAVLNFLPSLPESQVVNNRFDMSLVNASNGRPLKICNDLDISPDGQRIYITETDQEATENGPAAVKQIVTQSLDGKIWQVDLEANALKLLGTGYSFADGILLDVDQRTQQEKGVIFTALGQFKILEIDLDKKFSTTKQEVLIDNLPGLPDGLDRDPMGNIHVALFKDVTPTILFLQAHPEKLAQLAGLPYSQLPLPKQTGLMILDSTGRKPLYYTMHDASFIREVPATSASGRWIFLAPFSDEATGLYFVPNPLMSSGVMQ